MGILANHVPAIEPLKPGVIEVIESAGQSKKWFGASTILEAVHCIGNKC
jgi:F-type H+-transporting ATPase subunit delta